MKCLERREGRVYTGEKKPNHQAGHGVRIKPLKFFDTLSDAGAWGPVQGYRWCWFMASFAHKAALLKEVS